MRKNSSIKLLVVSDLHLTGEGNSYLSRKYLGILNDAVLSVFARKSKSREWGEFRSAAETLSRLRELFDLSIDSVDHIIISGDLIDSGRPGQLTGLEKLLSSYPPEKVSIVPGNHDVPLLGNPFPPILPSPSRPFFKRLFKPDESGDRFNSGKILFTRKVGESFLLIGINSCRNHNLHIRGKLGPELLSDIEDIIENRDHESAVKIIVMHHNPVVADRLNYDYLPGRDEFLEIISNHAGKSGRRDIFVFYGHSHRKMISPVLVDGACFVCSPMLAIESEEDHVLFEINEDGSFDDIQV